MQHTATALLDHLLLDLDGVLDEYQLASIRRGDDIWPDATLAQARAFFLGKALVKKYNDEASPSKAATDKALDKFHEGNDRCAAWDLVLESVRDEELYNGVRDVIYEFWYPDFREGRAAPLVSSYNQLAAYGRLGPGSNIGCRGADLFTKLFDSPITATSDDLVFCYTKITSDNPRWASAEKQRRKRYGVKLVGGNNLSFVNKNVDVARSISTEPTINMWFQLGLGKIMEQQLYRSFGIDLSTQPEINQALAQRGSRTGRLATIDLENASNSLGNNMIRGLVPASCWAFLSKLRSPMVSLPGGETRELHMVATMGNGFCFPLQTLVFAASVVAAYRALGILPQGFGPSDTRNFGVFGDDIICESRAFPLVIRILRMLGFRENSDKTFVEGPFRESCGGDYWHGHPCRGVYIKHLRNKQDCWVAINALNRWTGETGIVIPNLVQFLASKAGPLYTVPLDENDDAGVKVPLARHSMRHLKHGIVPYIAHVPRMSYLTVQENGDITLDVRDRSEKHRHSNDDASYLVFLHGDIRGYRISLRQRDVRYRQKRKTTPSWDRILPQASTTELTGPRLAAAVEINLFSDL